MRVVVFGGRNYRDRQHLFKVLDQIDQDECIECIIEGEAPGADRLARSWAAARGVPYAPYPADWDDISHPDSVVRTRLDGSTYDVMAGFRRNTMMIHEGRPNLGVAFPGGSGTRDMMTQVLEAGIELRKIS